MRHFYASSYAPFHWIFWVSRMRSQERVSLKTERLFFSVLLAFPLRSLCVPQAFPKHSSLRSLSVPVTRSLLGYFCPVLYIDSWQCLMEKNKSFWKMFHNSGPKHDPWRHPFFIFCHSLVAVPSFTLPSRCSK